MTIRDLLDKLVGAKEKLINVWHINKGEVTYQGSYEDMDYDTKWLTVTAFYIENDGKSVIIIAEDEDYFLD